MQSSDRENICKIIVFSVKLVLNGNLSVDLGSFYDFFTLLLALLADFSHVYGLHSDVLCFFFSPLVTKLHQKPMYSVCK